MVRCRDDGLLVASARRPGAPQWAKRGGAEVRRFFPFDADERVWCDDLSVGGEGVLVEVTHALVATADEQLTDCSTSAIRIPCF